MLNRNKMLRVIPAILTFAAPSVALADRAITIGAPPVNRRSRRAPISSSRE